MATMNKCHQHIAWQNDTTPAINDQNLGQYDGELDTLDDRIITLNTIKAEESDLLLAFKDVSLDSTTGVITFTLFNNTTKTIDTLLEKIAINFDYDDDPTSPHYQNLIIELEDGTYKYIDLSALITQYEFVTSSTIAFTVGNDGSVSASVVDGSITNAKLNAEVMATIQGYDNTALINALKSEGFAVGEQNGTPVASGSPYYQNNAKDYSLVSEGYAVGSQGGVDVTSGSPYFENNAEYYAGQAADSATICSNAEANINTAINMVQFSVNTTTGELEYDNDISYAFTINETTGNLEWEVNVA